MIVLTVVGLVYCLYEDELHFACQRLEYFAVDVSKDSELDALDAVLRYCITERTERWYWSGCLARTTSTKPLLSALGLT